VREGREQAGELPGPLRHHGCLPTIITSGVLPVPVDPDHHGPLSPSKSEPPSVGQQMLLLKPSLSWTRGCQVSSACSRLWAAPTYTSRDPDTRLGRQRTSRTAWDVAGAAVLISWVPLLLPLKAFLDPPPPQILKSQWWHSPKPSFSQPVGKPPLTLSLQWQQGEMEFRRYGTRVTPMSNTQRSSGPTSTK